LTQYRLIVFCDCPVPARLNLPKNCRCVYSYLDALPEELKIREIPGRFPAGPVVFEGILSGTSVLPELELPRVEPMPDPESKVLARLSDGSPAMTLKGNLIYSVLPVMKWRQLRELAAYCGCRGYGKAPCTVYGDSRFLAWFSHDSPEKFTMSIHGKTVYSSNSDKE